MFISSKENIAIDAWHEIRKKFTMLRFFKTFITFMLITVRCDSWLLAIFNSYELCGRPPPLSDPSYDPHLPIRAKISLTQAYFIPANINSVVSIFPSDLI